MSRQATLYELTGEYAELVSALELAETEEEAAAIWQRLDTAEEGIVQKAEAYARIMRNKQAEADALKAEKQRLEQLQRGAERIVETLKSHLLEGMKQIGVQEIQTGIGKWRVQKNPFSVTVLDEAAVPTAFHIPQPDKIDKAEILRHFKETGEIVDGIEVARNDSLRFR